MWSIVEINANLFQAWLFIWFMKHRLHLKQHHKAQEVVYIAAITGFLSLQSFTELSFPDFVVFLFPLLFAFTCSKDPWYIGALWSCVLAVLVLTEIPLILNIIASVPGITYDMMMEQTSIRIGILVIVNGVLLLLIWLTTFLRKEYSSNHWPTLIAFSLTIISALITEEAVYALQTAVNEQAIHASFFIWAYLGILFVIVLTIILFHLMSRSMENENRFRMEIANIEKAKQSADELEMMYIRLTDMKHDLKHHYETVGSMIVQRQHSEAEAYAKEAQSLLEQAQYKWTGSCAIDALILAKSMTMQKNKIHFHLDPYPLKQLPLPETDFCAMLGNILDNAIEGTCRVECDNNERIVQLSFSRSKDMLYLYCTNPCFETGILRMGDGWISSKKDTRKSEYGIGIRSIQRIVNSANGRVEFRVADGKFTVKVVLPYE